MASIGDEYIFSQEQEELVELQETHVSESVDELCCLIREKFLHHLETIGLISNENSGGKRCDSKDTVRSYHAIQRAEYRSKQCNFVAQYGEKLINHFANGREVVPNSIRPILCPVVACSEDSLLFRLATLLWSVPVSSGYGRRMRYLVKDQANGKLIGLFALADPVFNLQARDNWIGWTSTDRRQRLVHVMDAHIMGAVPPYSQLLGGKLVASLMTSQDICKAFDVKYGNSQGIISGQYKHPQLALITVTSALGRSSLYNRLKLPGVMEFYKIGVTEGWGHFQVPDKLFLDMRKLLELEGHPYASNYRFGQGPNWRLRVIRLVLTRIGLNPDLLRHGIAREVYASPLGLNWREFLHGTDDNCIIQRPSSLEIGDLAVQRWMTPRADRNPNFRDWTKYDTWNALTIGSSSEISDG